MADVDFMNVIYDLEGMGFYEIILPFLLIFAVMFAVLQKASIFQDKKINAVIALIAGFLMMRNSLLIEFMNDIIARFSVILIVILAFLIIFGIFGSTTTEWGKGFFAIFVIFALVAGIWTLADRLGYYDFIDLDGDLGYFWDENKSTILLVGIVLLIMGIVLVSPSSTGGVFGRAGEQLGHPGGNRGGG